LAALVATCWITLWACATPRRPEFVLLTFDGGRELEMWHRSMAFAQGRGVKLTYFLTGAFISTGRDLQFRETNVGFGDSGLAERLTLVQAAKQAGHEIASHGLTHLSGLNHTENEWLAEIDPFRALLAKQTGILTVSGFRAPYMHWNHNLFSAESGEGLKYDSSVMSAEHAFGCGPFMVNGVMELPLFRARDRRGRMNSMM